MNKLNKNGIKAYLHCGLCLDELMASKELSSKYSPRDYQRIQAGWTREGIQIWCVRHEVNILHIDFEGIKHRADSTMAKPKVEKKLTN